MIVPRGYADARRGHYLEYVERNFMIFRPFIFLDANSAAAWIPFGKAEFDKICQDAARHVPQEVHIARNVLVQGLNHWIATCKTKFRKQCVLEATYGASPLLALETLRRQTHRSVVKTVLDKHSHLILQFLSMSPVKHAVEPPALPVRSAAGAAAGPMGRRAPGERRHRGRERSRSRPFA